MHQGETDATNMTSGAQYKADLANLAASYRANLGNLPLFMCQLGRSTTPVDQKNRTDETVQPIRVAQHDSDNPPSVYLAATAIDVDVDATDHYTKTGYDKLGPRIAGAIAYHYRATGAPAAYRGPEIASVSFSDLSKAKIDVHLRHRGGTDFSPPRASTASRCSTVARRCPSALRRARTPPPSPSCCRGPSSAPAPSAICTASCRFKRSPTPFTTIRCSGCPSSPRRPTSRCPEFAVCPGDGLIGENDVVAPEIERDGAPKDWQVQDALHPGPGGHAGLGVRLERVDLQLGSFRPTSPS